MFYQREKSYMDYEIYLFHQDIYKLDVAKKRYQLCAISDPSLVLLPSFAFLSRRFLPVRCEAGLSRGLALWTFMASICTRSFVSNWKALLSSRLERWTSIWRHFFKLILYSKLGTIICCISGLLTCLYKARPCNQTLWHK